MTETAPGSRNDPKRVAEAGHADMEVFVGYILLGGVLLSAALVAAGLMWHWMATGTLGLNYSIGRVNLFQFVIMEGHQVGQGTITSRLLVNLGLATLMLTPYARVLVSMLYFALAEHNRKYTLFTGFVFVVLTYSLFLR